MFAAILAVAFAVACSGERKEMNEQEKKEVNTATAVADSVETVAKEVEAAAEGLDASMDDLDDI